ncbi:MAG: zinc-ribbon domain-containing protein, partial [Clostridiales bacterium]|nr:zinc-ribbon domain-containing protein [Clostridiales bacterium]
AGASAAGQSPAGPAEKEQSAGAQPPAGQEPAVDARPLADSANAQPISAAQNPANAQASAASNPATASAASGQPISAQAEPQQTAAAPGQTGQAAWSTAGGAVQSQAGAASEQAGSYAQTQAQSADPAQRRCPACGAHNPANAAFCYACGKQLAQQAPSSQADGTFCQNCGTKNPANAAFCYGCGARLYRPAQQEQPGADAAHPYDAIKKQGSRTRSAASGGQMQTNAQTEAGGPVCPKCGTKNAAQAVFCQECGARLGGAVDPTRPYDAIKKQGSKSAAGGASAAPYGAAGQGAGQTSAPSQRAAYGQSAYRPAGSAAAQPGGQPYGAYGAAQPGGNAYGAGAPGSAQPGAAPQGQARPIYTPPLGTYRVPSYTIPQSRAATPLTPEEFAEERRLFLGQNEVYYEKKFAQLQSGQLTWNWAACCLTSFWLIYRRMYLWGYLSLLGQIILAAILAYAWPVAPLLFCILFGMFGNNIYKSHIEKEMKLVQRLSKQNRLIEYADKGGVRLVHPVIAGTIIGVYLIALLCSLYI